MAVAEITGTIGSDVELRYTPNGVAVSACRFAVYAGKTKEEEKITAWFTLKFWRQMAEKVNEGLKKGNRVIVEGKIKPPYLYKNKSGVDAVNQEIEVEKIWIVENYERKLFASAFDNDNQKARVSS